MNISDLKLAQTAVGRSEKIGHAADADTLIVMETKHAQTRRMETRWETQRRGVPQLHQQEITVSFLLS